MVQLRNIAVSVPGESSRAVIVSPLMLPILAYVWGPTLRKAEQKIQVNSHGDYGVTEVRSMRDAELQVQHASSHYVDLQTRTPGQVFGKVFNTPDAFANEFRKALAKYAVGEVDITVPDSALIAEVEELTKKAEDPITNDFDMEEIPLETEKIKGIGKARAKELLEKFEILTMQDLVDADAKVLAEELDKVSEAQVLAWQKEAIAQV